MGTKTKFLIMKAPKVGVLLLDQLNRIGLGPWQDTCPCSRYQRVSERFGLFSKV